MATAFGSQMWKALKPPWKFDPAQILEEREMRTVVLNIGMLLFCIFVFIAGVFIYIKGTPLHSLYMFKTAVADRNVDGAMRYLDIDSVADNPARANVMRAEIKELIANPLKTGKENIFILASERALWDWSIEQSGNTALVSLSDPKPARFKMRKAPDGHWRIVEFLNDTSKGPMYKSL